MYSTEAQRHFEKPRRAGVLPDPDLLGKAGVPGQGNYMLLYLKLDSDRKRITETSFLTYGCPAAIASGSWTADWLIGKTIDEALSLDAAMVETGLGGLPLGKEHCAPLAITALRDALRQL